MLLLQCKNIKKDFGIHQVLKSATLDLEEGERVGLVGKNGAGKTTLVNIIAGTIQPDAGELIWHRKDVRIGYLRQSVYYTADTLSEPNNEFLHISSELGVSKVYKWKDERLGFLSGGERTKLALAHIWSSHPSFLILDEPTNHLDLQGVQWLIDELKNYPGTILVISHDRYFLDQTVNRIIEIDSGTIEEYKGNYSFYREEKRRRYESQLRAYMIQEKYMKELESNIRRLKEWSLKAHRDSTKKYAKTGNKMGAKEYYRVKAKKMDKQVKSKIKKLEKLKREGIKRPDEEPEVRFAFRQCATYGKRVLEASNIRKCFGNRVLFEKSSFYVNRGERVGIFGPNGCGKTTLIKAVLGQEPIEGSLFLSPSVNIGYISQDIFDLERDERALDLLSQVSREEQGKIRTMLANLGLNEMLLNKPLKCLSAGERTRLKLANLLTREYELLILDEPTNHLDLYTMEQLEETLKQYEGTILLITHDRYMLEKICNKLLVFDNNQIFRFESGLVDYLKKESIQDNVARDDGLTREEARMIIETRITEVLGRLSGLEPDTPEYQELDVEFKKLIEERNKYRD